jgi:surface antigen
MVKSFAARFALVVSCILATAGVAAPASAAFWQCAPYARQISGIEIRGNADTWWNQAAGKYERGHAPKVGAVLAFAASHRMRVGHVAMVSRVVSDREVLLTHANWSRPGQIERDVRAIDVSPNGDWTMVKVWYAPQHGVGTTAYATRGFIYSGHAPRIEQSVEQDDAVDSATVIATTATVPAAPGIALDR